MDDVGRHEQCAKCNNFDKPTTHSKSSVKNVKQVSLIQGGRNFLNAERNYSLLGQRKNVYRRLFCNRGHKNFPFALVA